MVAFRKQTLLSLDDCLYALQETIPHLTRSSLHWCLQRHGISRLPEIAGDKSAKQPFKRYPIGYFQTSISPRFALRKVSFTYSWPWIERLFRLIAQERERQYRRKLPRSLDRGDPVPIYAVLTDTMRASNIGHPPVDTTAVPAH